VTLTTLVGFGSFFWSSYTGLISLGAAAIFGYIGALFGALVVLPALLGLLMRKNEAGQEPSREVAKTLKREEQQV
jgi:predicted RND superfamily exporter protein